MQRLARDRGLGLQDRTDCLSFEQLRLPASGQTVTQHAATAVRYQLLKNADWRRSRDPGQLTLVGANIDGAPAKTSSRTLRGNRAV